MLDESYPTPSEVDAWCAELRQRAATATFTASPLDTPSYGYTLAVRHTSGNVYLAFDSPHFERFYGYWQPAPGGGPAPLLVHVPGYGTELSAHPELVAAGFNVLHVNPLGYGTPSGPNEEKKVDGAWPVLPDTIFSFGERGYVDWLRDALVALRWARAQKCVQPDRVGFFGTSQGGGGALLLASLSAGEGVKAVAADVPYLTHFSLMGRQKSPGAYALAFRTLDRVREQHPGRLREAWRALGFIDTLSHAHRLAFPVLLTAGALDLSTPPVSIRSLFEALPGTRSYTELSGQAHAYTVPFLRLASAWFTLYV
ncbi:MAG: acetylxylan esterase [Planctomycetes bacterium]|nr:acetylxylan esterase [Planctomycetota bacterium]